MDTSCTGVEFFDFSNASEDQVLEIQEILRLARSNGFVELPWEIPLAEDYVVSTSISDQDRLNFETSPESQKSPAPVVNQPVLYTLPHPSVTSAPIIAPQQIPAQLQNQDLLPPPPPLDAYVAQQPTGMQMPAVTTIGHYPSPPYVFSRTYPYMRAYHHLGMPLFTCALPGSNDLNVMQSPYGQFMSLAAPVPHQEVKDADIRAAKTRGPSDRQFTRRSKKKHYANSSYSNPELGSSGESYQDALVGEEQMHDACDNLPSVTSVPLVPLSVPHSNFSVTSGGIPMHGYPPGMQSLPYSQISGPQTPSTPVYYVPIFNHHPYASYMPSPASGPMLLPMGMGNLQHINDSSAVLEKSVADQIYSPAEQMCEAPVEQSNLHDVAKIDSTEAVKCTEDMEEPKKLDVPEETNETINTLHDLALKDKCIQGRAKVAQSKNICRAKVAQSHDTCRAKVAQSHDSCRAKVAQSQDTCSDGSRCWADLFKKQHELNGVDRQTSDSESSSNGHAVSKDISNGKLYSVPDEDIL